MSLSKFSAILVQHSIRVVTTDTWCDDGILQKKKNNIHITWLVFIALFLRESLECMNHGNCQRITGQFLSEGHLQLHHGNLVVVSWQFLCYLGWPVLLEVYYFPLTRILQQY